MKRSVILAMVFVAAFFVSPRPAFAVSNCTTPNTNCKSDADCGGVGGYCINEICKCPASAAPPICGASDSCAALPTCTGGVGTCGIHQVSVPWPAPGDSAQTVYVTDCRGLGSTPHFRAFVISYCIQNINLPPIGSFDGANCNTAAGWAFDPEYAGATTVSIYRDGPAGAGGTLAATVTANQSRPDVGAVYPGRTNSGWSWTIPASLKNGAAHTLYAYATNVNSSGGASGANVLLGGAPRSITCNTQPTGTFTNAVCAFPTVTATGTATDPQGAPVTVSIYDGQAGSGGVLKGSVNNANPNFSVSFPAFNDSATHTLYAYANDIPSGTPYQIGTHTAACSAPPTAAITGVAQPNYCSGAPSATVTWTYSSPAGLAEGWWQLQIATDQLFNNKVFDSMKRAGTNTTSGTGNAVLTYHTTYYARVMVWDSSGNPSAWSANTSFKTPAGTYPQVSFTLNPAQPVAGSPTTFTDTTNYGGDVVESRLWTFGDGTVLQELPGTGTTTHTYAAEANGLTASLQVTTASMNPGDSCSATQNISAKKQVIPQFREVRPGQPSVSPAP